MRSFVDKPAQWEESAANLPSKIAIVLGIGSNWVVKYTEWAVPKIINWQHTSLTAEVQLEKMLELRTRFFFLMERGQEKQAIVFLGKNNRGAIGTVHLMDKSPKIYISPERRLVDAMEEGRVTIKGMAGIQIHRKP